MGREYEKRTMLASAEEGKFRTGKNIYIKYLKGGKLSAHQSIKAKCYDCNGMGEADTCDNEECALWAYSQFAPKRPKKPFSGTPNLLKRFKPGVGMVKK